MSNKILNIAKLRRPNRVCGEKRRRNAFTMLEIVVTVVIVGFLSASAAVKFSGSGTNNMAAKTNARQLALELMQCRRRAIAVGDNHVVVFQTTGGVVTGYRINRRLANNSLTPVDELRTFPTGLTITGAGTNPEFAFEGNSLTAHTITIAGPQRSYQVSVVQATGAVRVTAL